MADDSSGPAGAVKEPLTPAMTRLLEAESQADEIVRRAQNEADEIMLTAKRRAEEIEGTGSSTQAGAEAPPERADLEKQKNLILEEASRRVEMMRAAAAAHLSEAVEKVVAQLIAES